MAASEAVEEEMERASGNRQLRIDFCGRSLQVEIGYQT
jgi:hypothetical protein